MVLILTLEMKMVKLQWIKQESEMTKATGKLYIFYNHQVLYFFSALKFEGFLQTSFSSIFTGLFCRIASFLQKILQELESCN